MSEFAVTFWGVRGGLPVPGATTLEFGGNTTCIEVRAGSHLIIIDAGTGIIALGAKLIAQRARDHRPIVATVLFTHGHHDHTQGLGFFEPLRLADSQIHVLGPRVFGEDLSTVLQRAMEPTMVPFPLNTRPGIRSIRNVQNRDVIVLTQRDLPPLVCHLGRGDHCVPPGAVKIEVHHSSRHPKGGSLSYGIVYQGKRFVFATDTEGYQEGDGQLVRFAHGADLLVHDAEYTDDEYTGPPTHHQGWGHSTWKMAVRVGEQAAVKRLALTHHHARHDDAFMHEIERQVQEVFPRAFVVREGMTVLL